MRLSTSCALTVLLLSVLPAARLAAQNSPANFSSDSAYAAAIRQYHRAVAPEVALYRGAQYVDYSHTVQQGQPFFGPDSLRYGSVWYSGIRYDSVRMMFDLVKDQLVITDPFNVFRISLIMDFVDSFSLDDQLFLPIGDSTAPDFIRGRYCDRIYHGRQFDLYMRDRKYIRENLVVTPDNVRFFIDEYFGFYFFQNGKYHAVNTKKQLLGFLRPRRSEVRRVIRKTKLRWRLNKQQILLAVARWYDGANH